MAKILWTYRDVTRFLEAHDFEFYDNLDNGESWVKLKKGEPDRFVAVKFPEKHYSHKAMEAMIRLSGIEEKEWIKWV